MLGFYFFVFNLVSEALTTAQLPRPGPLFIAKQRNVLIVTDLAKNARDVSHKTLTLLQTNDGNKTNT